MPTSIARTLETMMLLTIHTPFLNFTLPTQVAMTAAYLHGRACALADHKKPHAVLCLQPSSTPYSSAALKRKPQLILRDLTLTIDCGCPLILGKAGVVLNGIKDVEFILTSLNCAYAVL